MGEVDVLSKLKEEIESYDVQIEAILEDLASGAIREHEVEVRNRLRTTLATYKRGRAEVVRAYHATNQDLNIKNELLLTRIDRMKEEIKQMANSKGDQFVKVDNIISYLSGLRGEFESEEDDI